MGGAASAASPTYTNASEVRRCMIRGVGAVVEARSLPVWTQDNDIHVTIRWKEMQEDLEVCVDKVCKFPLCKGEL